MTIRPSTLLAWSPLICLLLFGLAYNLLPDSLTCSPINPGGREIICGGQYGHLAVRTAQYVFRIFYVTLTAATLVPLVRKQLSISGRAGLVFSAVFAALGALLHHRYANEDSP